METWSEKVQSSEQKLIYFNFNKFDSFPCFSFHSYIHSFPSAFVGEWVAASQPVSHDLISIPANQPSIQTKDKNIIKYTTCWLLRFTHRHRGCLLLVSKVSWNNFHRNFQPLVIQPRVRMDWIVSIEIKDDDGGKHLKSRICCCSLGVYASDKFFIIEKHTLHMSSYSPGPPVYASVIFSNPVIAEQQRIFVLFFTVVTTLRKGYWTHITSLFLLHIFFCFENHSDITTTLSLLANAWNFRAHLPKNSLTSHMIKAKNENATFMFSIIISRQTEEVELLQTLCNNTQKQTFV